MYCYRNISSAELAVLLNKKDILGKCDLTKRLPYTRPDKEIDIPVVCFFTDRIIRPSSEYKYFIKCNISEDRILAFGTGEYGMSPQNQFYKELYVEKYNYLDVIEIINI